MVEKTMGELLAEKVRVLAERYPEKEVIEETEKTMPAQQGRYGTGTPVEVNRVTKIKRKGLDGELCLMYMRDQCFCGCEGLYEKLYVKQDGREIVRIEANRKIDALFFETMEYNGMIGGEGVKYEIARELIDKLK